MNPYFKNSQSKTSGDIPAFLTHVDHNTPDRIFHRVVDGTTQALYKPADYDELKMKILNQHMLNHKSAVKLKKFEQVSKHSKNSNLLKQHHLVWRKELVRLNNSERRLENDLQKYMVEGANSADKLCQSYEDFIDLSIKLTAGLHKFKTESVTPVMNLRDDLQYWMHQNKQKLSTMSSEMTKECEKIKNTILHVTNQQKILLQQLEQDEISLAVQLYSGSLKDVNLLRKCPTVECGIPKRILELDCVDVALKEIIFQELLWLDEKYMSRLQQLNSQNSNLQRGFDLQKWSDEENYIFTCIMEQYTSDMTHKRQLAIDRLIRQFPHKSRSDIVAHESWHDAVVYYNNRKYAICCDWLRDKAELITKAEVMFYEVEQLQDYGDMKAEMNIKQEAYCRKLADKVKEWQAMKLEAMVLEEQMELSRREKEKEVIKLELEKEKHKRMGIKQQINAYTEEKSKAAQQQEIKTRERLEKLKELLSEQAKYDKERVDYRVMEVEIKNQAKIAKDLDKHEKEVEKEKRLEALRSQVRVIAESDPVRTAQLTENWYHHILPHPSSDLDINKPLFDIHGYTSKNIMSDNRVKLEEKLREAGVLNTVYARRVLSAVTPPCLPRKDMKSNILFNEDNIGSDL